MWTRYWLSEKLIYHERVAQVRARVVRAKVIHLHIHFNAHFSIMTAERYPFKVVPFIIQWAPRIKRANNKTHIIITHHLGRMPHCFRSIRRHCCNGRSGCLKKQSDANLTAWLKNYMHTRHRFLRPRELSIYSRARQAKWCISFSAPLTFSDWDDSAPSRWENYSNSNSLGWKFRRSRVYFGSHLMMFVRGVIRNCSRNKICLKLE
jgi:hypothetical protein